MRYTVRHRRRLKTPTQQAAVPVGDAVAAAVETMPYAGAGEIVEVVETDKADEAKQE